MQTIMIKYIERTSAPNSMRVSIRTAVCTVMCKQPAIRAPFKIFWGPYFFLIAIRPGISCSAKIISFRPHSANVKSAIIIKMILLIENLCSIIHEILESTSFYDIFKCFKFFNQMKTKFFYILSCHHSIYTIRTNKLIII